MNNNKVHWQRPTAGILNSTLIYTNRMVLMSMVIDYAVSTTKCRTMAKQRVRTSSKKLSQLNTNKGGIRDQPVQISMFE